MIIDLNINLEIKKANDKEFIERLIRKEIKSNDPFTYRWEKRSIDARKEQIKIIGRITIAVNEKLPLRIPKFDFQNVSKSKPVHIIGSGPAGLFAALECLLIGMKPIIIERGKNVRDRRRDLALLTKKRILNTESNYCFGEGGAGTYSDGKLYTRSKKRGDIQKVLQLLDFFGADENILVDSHPHIGTNKLPVIIERIRKFIISKGGEIQFESKVVDMKLIKDQIVSIKIKNKGWVNCTELILATGHSSREIYYLLDSHGIQLKAKSFAIGVRIEHLQKTINDIQYHGKMNESLLPAASYSLSTQVDGRGVYSFCMCPGGIIAPCSTEENAVVTNGWSPSKRNNLHANSGIVVSIYPEDLKEKGPFACLNFQKKIEENAYILAGKNQKIPAQKLIDFINKRKSDSLPKSSYFIGLESVEMDEVFPPFVIDRIRKGLKVFCSKMKGFLSENAVVHAPESRTSSTVLIPRDKTKLNHPEIKNLFPCGEGAGYAGGIVSAAVDGINCALRIYLNKSN